MAALTASSWVVTIISNSLDGGTPPRRKVVADLALAGVDTYPDGGIPLPSIGLLGFKRNIDSLSVTGVNAAAGTVADYMARYDPVNHKLFLYEEEAAAAGGPLLECDTAEVPGARTYRIEATGW